MTYTEMKKALSKNNNVTFNDDLNHIVVKTEKTEEEEEALLSWLNSKLNFTHFQANTFNFIADRYDFTVAVVFKNGRF